MKRHMGVSDWLTELWDRITASDPGLTRLSSATSTVIGVSSTLGVEYGFALITHANAMGTVISMLLGAVVTMMGMMALSGNLWSKVRIAAFFPVAFGVGMLSGVAVAGHTDLMLSVFVIVMFAAVAVRRFGIPFFFYGFMGWMGYFFSSFIGATITMIPGLLASVVLATVWAFLLSATVLRTNPTLTLRRTVRAFGARARTVAKVCEDLLAAADEDQRNALRRRLHARQTQLAEAALMVEGWSAEPFAMPPELSAPALRRRLIDIQHVLDRLAAHAETLTQSGPGIALAASQVAERLSIRNDAGAKQAAHDLIDLVDVPHDDDRRNRIAARQFAEAALEFVELAQGIFPPVQPDLALSEEPIDEFEPAVGLAFGNLPGSPAIAKEVPARGVRWNPLARLDYTTRQAIQSAIAGGLAILVGRELSPTRYYWSVIAAFVMFTGTATRTETFLKGFNRVIGTLVGLVAAIGMAEWTAGHLTWVLVVVLASIFCGFYLVRVSYAYMIFFITIMVGQLYSVLHEFSSGLLLLRLEETAVGAAIGFVVALSVVPVSTRDTVRFARNNLLTTLGALLNAAADQLERKSDARTDFDAWTRNLDNRLRQLALVAKPLTRPLIWGYSPRARHRLALYAAIATGARALAIALRHPYPREIGQLPAVCRALALVAVGITDRSAVQSELATIAGVLNEIPIITEDGTIDPVIRRLLHLRRLLDDLQTTSADPL